MDFDKSQAITFVGSEDYQSRAVYSSEIDVTVSSSSHTVGNSKVKLKNLVDYHWEHKYYLGKLVAVHLSGVYVAYVIKGPNNDIGIVSVLNLKTQERIRMKGKEGMIKDISFAHTKEEIILASVNEYGHLLVFQVNGLEFSLSYSVIVNIERSMDTASSDFHRVTWCPYIPDDDSDNEDVSKLLVLTHGCMAEMWNIEMVKREYGSGPLKPENVSEGYIHVDSHDYPIIDVAFSPDGSALAIAYENGIVKFFQVYIYNSDGPRCLHVWDPHMGKPLSSLFFLDNLKCPNPDVQYWKFAITGANNNREIKIWSCATWTALQTIHIHTPVDENCTLKAEIDLGSQFLILSDIFRNAFYVLHIEEKMEKVAVTSFSQFLLPCAVLSFCIVDAGVRKCKVDCDNAIEGNPLDDQEDHYTNNLVIKLYLVQPKSFQEGRITFQPATSAKMLPSSVASLSQESLIFRDTLSDLNMTSDVDSSQPEDTLSYPAINKTRSSLNNVSNSNILMTPDAFSSGQNGKMNEVSPVVNLAATTTESPRETVDKHDVPEKIPNGCTRSRSGGSSPSREVREILGENFCEAEKKSSDESGYHTEQKFESIEGSTTKFPTPPIPSETSYQASGLENAGSNGMSQGDTSVFLHGCTELDQLTADDLGLELLANHSVGSAGSSQGDDGVCSKEYEVVNGSLTCEHRTLEELSGEGLSRGLELLVHNEDPCNPSLGSHEKQSPLAHLIHNTNTILKVIHQQQAEITDLKRKINQMQICQIPQRPISNSTSQSLEDSIKILNNKVDSVLHSLSVGEKDKWQSLNVSIAEEVTKVVIANLRIMIRTEMKSPVVSVLLEQFEQVQTNILSEILQHLNATDRLIRDRIQCLMNNEEFQEVLSRSTAKKLQPAIMSSYKDSFANVIIPNFEKCSENMIKQINDHFSRGTKEYTEQLESYLDKHRKTLERTKDASGPVTSSAQMQTLLEGIGQSNRVLVSSMTSDMVNKLQGFSLSIQENLNKRIRDIVRGEVQKCFAEQKSVIEGSVLNAVRSRAVTPAPNMVDMQFQTNHILNLISTKQFNAAFQSALSASDLNIVVFTCEKVSPKELFSVSPCPLQQPILLSLIQQLSADLSSHTRLKHSYLSEAVMALNAEDPAVIEHMPTLLNTLLIKLKDFLNKCPSSPNFKEMKILSLVVQSLLSCCMSQ